MVTLVRRPSWRAVRWAAGILASLATLVVLSNGVFGAGAARATGSSAAQPAAQAVSQERVAPIATPGQDFQDVFPSNAFYSYLHNLKGANVVGGYSCVPGGPNDPCVPPDNLPYYHPSVAVTRLQMTKFIDLGRRNIADATGHSRYISHTAGLEAAAEPRA